MIVNLRAGTKVIPFAALLLSACVSQSSYDALKAQYDQAQTQNQQLQAQNQQLQEQVAGLQREARFVEAGDLLFASGSYKLTSAGQEELNKNIVPKITGLKNAKIVVYGYTDNAPVGAKLKRQGINDNLTISSLRAGEVVTYLIGQGVDENHPEAPNDSPENMAKNRRIVITVQGPGAPAS